MYPSKVGVRIFAVIWASFGVLHLYRTEDIWANVGETPAAHRFDRDVSFILGLLAGATVVSITGAGIDMILDAVMMCADLKVAIPSTVIIMAFTLALGAPFGAFIVNRIGRKYFAPVLYLI